MVVAFFLIALVLVVLGGLMSSVDSALSVQSRAEISALAVTSRFHAPLEAIAKDIGAHLNAVNFIRLLAETTAAVLVTLAFQSIFSQWWWSLILAALLMTVVSFVLVGVSPRSVGRAHADGILAVSAPLVHAVRVITGPLAAGLVALGNRVTPSRARSAPVSSEAQLLSIVDEATLLDVLEEDDRALIHSIFEFNETVVREVMIPRTDMVTLSASDSIRVAMTTFLGRGVSRIPVLDDDDDDDIVGVLYLRDVARFGFERPLDAERVPVGEVVRPPTFVPESKNADSLLAQMQSDSIHLAMVVDEYGAIAGLVTLEDLIEELVGDISDEYDRDVPLFEDLGGYRWRVSARLALDELGELFGIDLDDDDVDTVGGLMQKALGRLPVTGSVAHSDGLRLTADRTEGRRRRLITVVVERDADLAGVEDALSEGSES